MSFFRRLSILLVAVLSFEVATLGIATPANAATQKVTYYMNGDCSDYYDMNGEYAFFEEEPDWSCYITVKFTPAKPMRKIRLQYWTGRKWALESTSLTNSKGIGRLDFDPTCTDNGVESYCDGTWKYRVFVDPGSGQSQRTSSNFQVTFYPYSLEESDW